MKKILTIVLAALTWNTAQAAELHWSCTDSNYLNERSLYFYQNHLSNSGTLVIENYHDNLVPTPIMALTLNYEASGSYKGLDYSIFTATLKTKETIRGYFYFLQETPKTARAALKIPDYFMPGQDFTRSLECNTSN